MEQENKVEPVVEDDAALDAELDKSLNDMKAGNSPTPSAEVKTVKEEEGATGQTGDSSPTGQTGDAGKTPVVEKKEEGYEFRIPNKGKFESDESYELRIGLLDLVKKRKAATSPEAKQQLSEEIAKTKGQLKALNGPVARHLLYQWCLCCLRYRHLLRLPSAVHCEKHWSYL